MKLSEYLESKGLGIGSCADGRYSLKDQLKDLEELDKRFIDSHAKSVVVRDKAGFPIIELNGLDKILQDQKGLITIKLKEEIKLKKVKYI